MQKYGTDRTWPFAQGGGLTIIIVTTVALTALVLYLVAPAFWSGALLAVAAFLWLLILYFFRDPNRTLDTPEGVVVSPGDGKVVAIVDDEEESTYLNRRCRRISLFLSITDVHVQRVPVAGKVVEVTHRPGRFLQAFRPEASTVNEHIAMVLETPFGPVLVKQIAGIVARRCVNYMSPGDEVATGQRFGLIRFGSRVDLYLPPSAEIVTEIGTQAYGGVTELARFPVARTRDRVARRSVRR